MKMHEAMECHANDVQCPCRAASLKSGALFDRNSSVAHGAGIHGGVGTGANLSATDVWRLHLKPTTLISAPKEFVISMWCYTAFLRGMKSRSLFCGICVFHSVFSYQGCLLKYRSFILLAARLSSEGLQLRTLRVQGIVEGSSLSCMPYSRWAAVKISQCGDHGFPVKTPEWMTIQT